MSIINFENSNVQNIIQDKFNLDIEKDMNAQKLTNILTENGLINTTINRILDR